MKESIKTIWDKICAGATVAGDLAVKTAENVGSKATDVYNASKINFKIFNLTTDIEVIYREIGRLIYAAHTNDESSSEVLDEMLDTIDAKKRQIEELRASIAAGKDTKVCPSCGRENASDSNFCSSCGLTFEE